MAKYPEVKFELVGIDSNAFSILGTAQKAARRAGLSKDQIEEYLSEAMGGDYDNVISTTMRYFDCTGEGDDGMTEAEADAEWDEYWAECDRERDES